MHISPKSLGLTSAALGLSLALPGFAEADFFEDSKADLEFRNFYFNSDYHQQGAPQSERDEWAQGLLLNYESGFTDGTFDFASASYNWRKGLTTSYNYGGLGNNYKQHIVTLLHSLPLGETQSLKSDLRYARSLKDGYTNIDNTAVGAKFTYSVGGHGFGVAYQRMNGETGFPHLAGTDSFLVTLPLL